MSIKEKWNGLDKSKKVMVGIGSAVAVAAVGTGAVIGATSTDQPAQTKVAEKPNGTTDVLAKEKDEEKDETNFASEDKKVETDKKVAKVDDADEGKDVDKSKEEKKSKIKEKDEKKGTKKDEKKKETVTLKDDGTKVKVTQSSGKTPSATVKVEKKAEKTATNNSSSTQRKSQTNNSSSKTNKHSTTSNKSSTSKPKDSITTKTTTATKTINFKTIKQNDSSLEKGKTKVAQNGQNGTRTITYKETYKNGKLVSKKQVSSKVTKNPVNKIIKVGTKEAPKQPSKLSSSQAHSILAGSGMSKSGNNYNLRVTSDHVPVTVSVGSNGVTRITFNADYYIPWKYGTLKELQEILGKKEGKKEYDYGQQQAKKIERAVRAAANAVYGSGTSKANSLYNEIIKSQGFARNF